MTTIAYTCVACGVHVTRPRMNGRIPTLCPPCGLHGVRDRTIFFAERRIEPESPAPIHHPEPTHNDEVAPSPSKTRFR